MKQTTGRIILCAIVAAIFYSFGANAGVAYLGASVNDRGELERTYGLSPICEEWGGPQSCSQSDCELSRYGKCTDNGHGAVGEATEQNATYHLDASGTGDCLITCDDGYMILIVEDNCEDAGSHRLLYELPVPTTHGESMMREAIIRSRTPRVDHAPTASRCLIWSGDWCVAEDIGGLFFYWGERD